MAPSVESDSSLLLIRDVRVPQSASEGPRVCDIELQDGLIHALHEPGLKTPPGATVIDGAHRVALPGLIDAHVHAEGALGDLDAESALLHQGITAAVIGQDGLSIAPMTGSMSVANSMYFGAINGPVPPGLQGNVGVGRALDVLTSGARLHAAMLVPCGSVRMGVAGFRDGPLSDEELGRVSRVVHEALDEGAVGLSLGLEYVPGAFADERELRLYADIASARGVPVVAHIRGYEEDAPAGLDEFLELGRASGAALHVSHLHGNAATILPIIDTAIAQGIDLTFDSYPYRRGNTILAMLALPAGIQEAGPEGTLAVLASASARTKLATDWFPEKQELLGRVTISSVKHAEWKWCEGMGLVAAAQQMNLSLTEFTCRIIRENDLAVGAVVEQPQTNSPGDVRQIANHGAHLGSSDGVYVGGHPHPRGWGSFARMLRRHVLDWADWTWWDATEHLSARAARRFQLVGRGTLVPGAHADLCLIDPERLTDEATYAVPQKTASGITDVFVAGQHVVRNGAVTDVRPGVPLRCGERGDQNGRG